MVKIHHARTPLSHSKQLFRKWEMIQTVWVYFVLQKDFYNHDNAPGHHLSTPSVQEFQPLCLHCIDN